MAGGPGGHWHVALSGPAAGSHLGAAAPGGHPRAPAARGRGRGGPFRSLCLRLAGHRAPRCSPTWAKQRARTRSGNRPWPRVSGGCGEAARPSRGSGSPGVWRRLAGSTAAGWERGPGQGLPRPQAGGRPQEALRAAAGQRPGWAAERSRRPPLLADPVAPRVCGRQGRRVILWVTSGVTNLNTHVPGDVRAKWRAQGACWSAARWVRSGGRHTPVSRPRGGQPSAWASRGSGLIRPFGTDALPQPRRLEASGTPAPASEPTRALRREA